MQTLKFIRRRFPNSYPMLVSALCLVASALLVLGIGMLFVR